LNINVLIQRSTERREKAASSNDDDDDILPIYRRYRRQKLGLYWAGPARLA